MRFLRFKRWLTEIKNTAGGIDVVYLEEVRRHAGTNAAHIYGGLAGASSPPGASTTEFPYQGVPVGTIKRHVTGKGNASKDAVIEAVRAQRLRTRRRQRGRRHRAAVVGDSKPGLETDQ